MLVGGMLAMLGALPVAGATIERVSLAPDGGEANGGSFVSAVSPDGSVVAFASAASNLVAGDRNGVLDIFVYDRATATTERVSVGPGGYGGDGPSAGVALSEGGHLVAFASAASNLVANDTNGVHDVFVRDRRAGTTERVSVSSDGGQADGSSVGNVSISADGRFVAFRSFAANLVPGDTNGATDVFVRDRQEDTTERVSVGLRGPGSGMSFWPSISGDGRAVAFASASDDLVASDTNRVTDVFVRDRVRGVTERVSVGPAGREMTNASIGFPALSADGRIVAFTSGARKLLPAGQDANGQVDVFVRDRASGDTVRASVGSGGIEGDGGSIEGALSPDGRFVAFYSAAANLVPGDANAVFDVFMHDRETGSTVRLAAGDAATYVSGAAVSWDGGVVTFYGEAANIVAGDTNALSDVFVWAR